MEVTRQNFKDTLPVIQSSIERADFLVIDAEFTGLSKGRDVSLFDSPSEYYSAILNGSSEFLLTQYGLCAFYWDADKNEYRNEAYNFYLFPRGNYALEKIFLCQSSSLDFLAAQGFDFNKWIKDGISYATEPVEQYMRTKILEKQSKDNEWQHIPVPDENKQQIEDICKRVKEFIDNSDQDEMIIDRCNPFIRRLLFQELGTRFKDEVLVDTKVLENKERVLIVTRIKSAEDTNNRKKMKAQKEWDDLEEAVGFSKVARMISQSGKLVVGHNMLLDVLHTLSHFFQEPPSDYNTFKEFAHCMFPRILDTKYMSSMPPFKDKVNSNVLQHLYLSLSEEPFSLPKIGSESGRGYAGADDKHHEAGYDAFVTGACLLAMHRHLRGESGPVLDEHLRPFVNKLFLAKTARQDSPYMNLEGDDPVPSREHVFHMTFPKEWQRNEINQLFSPFGQIIVQFLDDTSAYVALANRKRSREMMKALSGHEKVTLVPFAVHKGLLQGKIENQSTTKTAILRTPSAVARQDSREDHKRKNGSLQTSVPVPRPEKITIELDEPVDPPAPSAKKSRTRSTSSSKETEKHKMTEDHEVASQPALKRSRSRTTSVSQNNWKIEDITPEYEVEKEKSEKERKRAKPQAEDVFAGSPRTVSVFKESDSWL